ncbi:MAG: hypothetical protein M3120_02365 [Pseudomonadota bacterium]|nr:hypothetical protein [Pseudomonadota bacterium]
MITEDCLDTEYDGLGKAVAMIIILMFLMLAPDAADTLQAFDAVDITSYKPAPAGQPSAGSAPKLPIRVSLATATDTPSKTMSYTKWHLSLYVHGTPDLPVRTYRHVGQ